MLLFFACRTNIALAVRTVVVLQQCRYAQAKQTWHFGGNRHYPAHTLVHRVSSVVPSETNLFTGAIAGSRPYWTGTIEGLDHYYCTTLLLFCNVKQA